MQLLATTRPINRAMKSRVGTGLGSRMTFQSDVRNGSKAAGKRGKQTLVLAYERFRYDPAV